MENYVSAQIGCSRLLDRYRFFSSSLDKLGKILENVPISDFNNFKENSLEDDLLKNKLAYPYEYLTLSNFQQRLNVTKEYFRSTLKQSYPSDGKINRTKEIILKKWHKERTRINYVPFAIGCSTISRCNRKLCGKFYTRI